MKELYERPMITVEEFTVNRAIAACGDETSRPITFDCMIGPNLDITNVLTTNCSRKAGTTTAKTAQTTASFDHSNVTGGTWGWSDGMRTYTAPKGATGLIYFCTYTNGSSCFTESNGVLTHGQTHSNGGPGGPGGHGGHGGGQVQYHVEVAPVYGPDIEAVNTGS